MKNFSGFFRKSYQDRLALVADFAKLDEQNLATIKYNFQAVSDELIENYLTDYGLPEGIATNLLINNKEYLVPMVVEEPSVIAAASNGAKMLADGGGIHAEAEGRVLTGEIIIKTDNVLLIEDWFTENKQLLIQCALDAHPSIINHGGVRDIKYNMIDEEHISLELFVDVGDAMGANTMNSMLEAVAKLIETDLGEEVLMSILSNYGDHNLVVATGIVPFASLQRGNISGKEVAQRIAEAAHVANIYSKRAATHNKGIMNGIDAVVVATGNDWRAVESAAHSYAARKGNYKGLTKWRVTEAGLEGRIKLPIPTGTVGGATHLLPMSKINYQILQLDSALEMMNLLAGVGLAQNLAALKALVTDGIQRGHMKLQLKSLAMTAGATSNQIKEVVIKLAQLPLQEQNLEKAQQIVKEIKQESENHHE
ncbi:hydroxymethylglutaryl-CoA reductase, degradative [Fructilactobacillus lindneri]|uniref:3-hydroxy-3-methylglutaryl coenzyme A reductase n=2 Tax=Fructilactobacillus lindneri TaxID=53444 RepID=A0A0R2JUB1_9LACO|nr:hydroxymethylglutaryl-CoA reductase, degradative [Fructilactobacillus lindneri]ANZ57358.1 3-hydroxy-3-methylglutaryl-CoA reductase [Fructilactobacillus lindneri]ANZ58623.1 3-hydroxy-3-methylglutaryl-CoA reductase [Fructilactobacillus lindneri]KRN80706.1 3-hydroxy-3-methylglutaryl-CoA reductase [Fructilactobacillus lindneri DSM 20690 = JCM 11027]POG97661.1 hydroxymethylglutaryl-CoA reductase, degradative [Fructilactobacillus lindneri]POG98998.1 hydroxymethylglutaryl-CoA reductase, degradativ